MSTFVANIPGSGLCEIQIEDGYIARVTRLGFAESDKPFCSPGFVDLQLNGFSGLNFSDPDLTVEGIARMLPALWATGCTTFCPTLITNSVERLESSFRKMEKARETLPHFAKSAPSYHLEGPYLSPGPSHGTHDPALMRPACIAEFERLQRAARGRIDILTLAPEVAGAIDLTRHASQSGVVVAISHTDGQAADVHAAVAAGASMSTHWGNGCATTIHRHQAPLWAQLAADGLSAGIICDGFHLPREHVQIAYRIKGAARVFLVTDAVHVAGLSPGRYRLVNQEIELLETGQVVTSDRRSMAGSTLTMNAAVWNFMQMTDAPLAAAVELATKSPAGALRRRALTKTVAAGELANLVLFTLERGRLVVVRTLLAGEVVYAREEQLP